MSRTPKALFVSSTRIGDCVISSGVLREIARRLPGVAITVACGPLAAPLFRSAPHVERVIVMAKRPADLHWLDLWRATIGRRWDLVVDVRASGLAWLLLARRRIVYSRKVERPRSPRVLNITRMMGAERPLEPELFLDDAAREAADALIGEDRRPILAVAPVSAGPERTWPLDRFATLLERLRARPEFSGWRVMVAGGPADREPCAPVLAAAGEGAIDALGRLDILAAGAAMARAAMFVGNDSGLAHIAAAAGTPTLALVAITDPQVVAPWGPTVATACPAQNGELLPMSALSLEAVEAAVLSLRSQVSL